MIFLLLAGCILVFYVLRKLCKPTPYDKQISDSEQERFLKEYRYTHENISAKRKR